jgi:serine/threonine protein kinase
MERGRSIKRMNNQYANVLKEKLRTMHELNIVHCDIKPDNIVISEELGEPLFIDFGLSEIIKESCGFKTLCAFRGTPNYCSPEMIGIIGKGAAFVDLYYNDACGLQITAYKESLIKQDEVFNEIE